MNITLPSRIDSLSSLKGGEGQGEEPKNSEINIPSPKPSSQFDGAGEKNLL